MMPLEETKPPPSPLENMDAAKHTTIPQGVLQQQPNEAQAVDPERHFPSPRQVFLVLATILVVAGAIVAFVGCECTYP